MSRKAHGEFTRQAVELFYIAQRKSKKLRSMSIVMCQCTLSGIDERIRVRQSGFKVMVYRL